MLATKHKHTYACLANKPSNSLQFTSEGGLPGFKGTCQDRWCWADVLFMAPRTWYQLAARHLLPQGLRGV